MSDALSFADIDGQHVELLPARTVLSAFGGYTDSGDGGDGGHGGDNNKGGDGGDANAEVKNNYNSGDHSKGVVWQNNFAFAEGGDGADAGTADGGDGGDID